MPTHVRTEILIKLSLLQSTFINTSAPSTEANFTSSIHWLLWGLSAFLKPLPSSKQINIIIR